MTMQNLLISEAAEDRIVPSEISWLD